MASNARPGRNEPCPCGSGQKYKKCCGAGKDAALPAPSRVRELYAPALACLYSGDLHGAESLCRQMLESDPLDVDALNLFAVVACQLGRYHQAAHSLSVALALRPREAQFRANLANILREQERFEEAARQYREALGLEADNFGARLGLGLALADAGQTEEARTWFAAQADAATDFAEARELADVLREMERWHEAAACLEGLIARRPDDVELLNDCGAVLLAAGRLGQGAQCLERARELAPDAPEVHANLATLELLRGHLDAARARYRRVLEVRPDYAEVCFNLARLELASADEAAGLAMLDRALGLDPRMARAHLVRALVLLRRGDYLAAWPDYEWRLEEGRLAEWRRRLVRPIWRSETLEGRTIVLHAEQGLGDTIQFVRYAPLLAARGAKVIVQCDRALTRLLASASGVSRVVARGESLPPHDLCCPLMSLPSRFGTTLHTVPADVPYLHAPPDEVEAWRCRLAPDAVRLRVGVVWAGSPKFAADAQRSVPPCAFAPLAGVPGVAFFSLQKDPAARQISQFPDGMRLTDLAADLADFAATAAAMANLDLVISVDTAAVHLAGALARPAWLLNRADGDWRWLDRGERTPWYPTIRIFRQRRTAEWQPVMEEVRDALATMAVDVGRNETSARRPA
jgi:Flp pilus assembly protein TadD